MSRVTRSAIAFAALAAAIWAGPVLAQSYPTKPIRIMSGFAPGGPTDILGRIVGEHFQKVWGQSGVVENRAGLGGSLAADVVAKAAPDGYTLLSTGVGAVAINQTLMPQLSYDPERDLTPVSMAVITPMVVSVAATVPVNSFREFVAYAKAQGGKLNHASPGTGSSSHLGAEAVKLKVGFDSQHIAYRGVPAMNDAIAKGEAQWTIDSPQGAMALHRDGKVKVLAIGSKERWPLFPEIPTFAEAGVPDFELMTWWAFAAPAGTPRDIVDRLSAEIANALKAPDAAQRVKNMGLVAIPGKPEDMAKMVEADTARWAQVIKEGNIKPE